MHDIIPDPALVRIAALVGTLTAAVVLCAGITVMIHADRLPPVMSATFGLDILDDADAPTQVFAIVEPITHGPGALPHWTPDDCYEGCDNDPCPAGLNHYQCLPACLTAGMVAVVPAPEPEYTGRHLEDTVEIVPPGWTPADDPEPGLVRPYLDHRQVSSWSGSTPGQAGAECACGAIFDGHGRLADAHRELDRHIADATTATAEIPAVTR